MYKTHRQAQELLPYSGQFFGLVMNHIGKHYSVLLIIGAIQGTEKQRYFHLIPYSVLVTKQVLLGLPWHKAAFTIEWVRPEEKR